MLNLGQKLDKDFGKLAKHEEDPATDGHTQCVTHLYYVVKKEPLLPKVLNWLSIFASGVVVGFLLKGLI